MTVSSRELTLLDQIETLEMRSLSWGYVDGSLAEDELLDLALDLAGSEDAADELIDRLIKLRLINELPTDGGGHRYRSRFAEMMRLLYRLRQLFDGRPWRNAPRLVADFRVDRRRRRFPRRDLLPAVLIRQHANTIGASSLRTSLWDALSGEPGLALAAFQERSIVRLLDSTGDTGTIVTAGTGSGKTLAFYLPAFMRVAERVDSDHWVKAIAIYPRIELLKDQIAEAYRLARRTDTVLRATGRRIVKIGALFGATPRRATQDEVRRRRWTFKQNGFVCPWLRCPTCRGKGELIWPAADLDAARERLVCTETDCGAVIGDDALILTRQRIQSQPPDILFTTTETLNQRLSDQWMRPVFGIGKVAAKRPFLALLDEVHTYVGPSGAHAGLVLRRWRHLLGSPVTFAGLSATLEGAQEFFASLTGVRVEHVVEVTPLSGEMIEEGTEYQVLLRGDPASRASLLSTTIQTAMLVARSLDPPRIGDPHRPTISEGTFGRRAFLFTDDLDVTNRLFHDLRDAEAYDIYGKPNPGRDTLASLRRQLPGQIDRDLEGQRWRMCEDIGHPLEQRLLIGRTTSQDAGVNNDANVVVATAALEVGYNDPFVGAVIQHKAPFGMASFVQRKGRAGRDRIMRPMTLTVLSDYGRDRIAFQSYEHLFEPTVPQQSLPIHNLAILRMQAVYALYDWLADRTSGSDKVWMWDILSHPQPKPSDPIQRVRKHVQGSLSALAKGEADAVRDLKTHLVGALKISADTADAILWEAPRSLILEAVPTMLRRLFRDWRLAFPTDGRIHDHYVDYHPLPDFAPRSLFSDLSLPEVKIDIPPADVNSEPKREELPIGQALSHLAPGRVTRRFGPERGKLSHWFPIDPAAPVQAIPIATYALEFDAFGAFSATLNGGTGEEVQVFRPWRIALAKVTRAEALPSTNARFVWCGDMEPTGEALTVPLPSRSTWHGTVQEIAFHIHRFNSSVRVRRFASTAHGTLRTLSTEMPFSTTFRAEDGAAAAVGFEIDVDGLHVDITLPDAATLAADLPVEIASNLRLAYLRQRFAGDRQLPDDLNIFQREWLFQILLVTALSAAVNTDQTLMVAALAILDAPSQHDPLAASVADFFASTPPPAEEADAEDDEDDDDDDRGPHRGGAIPRLARSLGSHFERPIIRERLRALAEEFETPDPTAFGAFLRHTLLETLGEAFLHACIAAAPRHITADALLLDFAETDDGSARIWITESTLGGAGVLQAFAERFAAEPRVFLDALEAALAPSDLELAAEGLRRFVDFSVQDPEIGSGIARLRGTNSHRERAELWKAFSRQLTRRGGFYLGHAFVVSLNGRLLRPGAGPLLDDLLARLLAFWDSLEARFGVAVGVREFSVIASRCEPIAEVVRTFARHTIPHAIATGVDVVGLVSDILWPRAAEIRQRSLQSYNPFRNRRTSDAALVRHLILADAGPRVIFGPEGWRDAMIAALEARGTVTIVAAPSEGAALRTMLVVLTATPIDVGYLQFYAAIDRIENDGADIAVRLILREQV
ncbi:protein DpdJ [Bosea sp. BIWAKO-01]|uniref:protein DpdJ n=1 Tax=Bosea sp. BIWAKO-01 TaxID=506668 RepID=UPI000853B040|nr:protein DpdJ [Bosea sp. BIWAKO-01]GAU81824.1 Lhr-like helicases [Bosea sp. BIWAKO-01]